MKKVCIIGHFGYGKKLLNGQTVKTRTITKGLINELGKSQVNTIDTHGGIKVVFKCFINLVKEFRQCENIVMFPAHNGVKIFTPIMLFLKKIFHRKIHYSVIGGWLPDLVSQNRILSFMLKKFDNIYVETFTMKMSLERQGFNNVTIFPNLKELEIVEIENISKKYKKPYKLCTFSRVMQEKGIEDAINAVKFINNKFGYNVLQLDIYGPIDSGQKEWFEGLEDNFPNYVTYKGSIDYNSSTDVLKDYYALLFPTRFFTEGIPGTIIDAYAAGVPVISSKWESFDDVVDDVKTGFGYTFNDLAEFEKVLEKAISKDDFLWSMRKNCIRKAEIYHLKNVMRYFKF